MLNRDDVSVITLVDTLLEQAIRLRASDIHCEPTAEGLRVRFRVDGILHDQGFIAAAVMHHVLSRVKLLAAIDIAERRVPQDGKFQTTVGTQVIDLRVATFPSLYGEKIVIRILDRHQTMLELTSLGFQPAMLASIRQLLTRPHGFLLVCGPTGSGKTTTLYAMLNTLNVAQKHCITLEDPIEYRFKGITQGQVHPEAGFTFERGIRALLRQDPDIVLIGEIRDKQTASIALEAALTGHLVLSTIHTNDAPSVIMRLMDMHIEPFLINAALTGVLAQRLVRTICVHCKQAATPTPDERETIQKLGYECPATLHRGVGCDICHGSGYKGRMGIFQLLTVTQQIKTLIVQHPSFDDIVAQAEADGMKSLLADGMEKVKAGSTTLEELLRVA